MAKRVTTKNVVKVLGNLTALLRDQPGAKAWFCHRLNTFLDNLADDDFFGTEGQLDPRGDKREA